MSQTDLGEGACAWGGQGRQGHVGRTGPDRAGLGRAGPHHGSKPTARTTTK
jgi:hypothetical protein